MTKLLAAGVLLLSLVNPLRASSPKVLNEENYQKFTPKGKEVDAIYGDFVLRNEHIVVVIAAPRENRDANLTVRNVGGSVIDITEADQQSDQLSCFYPGGGAYRFEKQIDWPYAFGHAPTDALALAFEGRAQPPAVEIQVGYLLLPGEKFLRVVSTISNTGDTPIQVRVRDGVRADGEFKFGLDQKLNLWWAQDEHWRQAYGVQPQQDELTITAQDPSSRRGPRPIAYARRGHNGEQIELAPSESFTWRRALFPGANSFDVKSIASSHRKQETAPFRLTVKDKFGPVVGARVEIQADSDSSEAVGVGHTDEHGRLDAAIPHGEYLLKVAAQGHNELLTSFSSGAKETVSMVELSTPVFVEGKITNGRGKPIPAKVQLVGQESTPSPNFGPDSAVRGVGNLQYTPDGRFRCKLLPGSYRWIVSYGPEHDAAEGEFRVAAGETISLRASLPRTVDTSGWLSSELHSHSSPSGDNTASQRGRVLNLLSEHLEFCPCTEHQRIDVYDEHLTHFDAAHRMLTCPGMELTGRPLPLNHQNAFPLLHRPHEQHGGAPSIHPDPVEQIERLASWDDNAEKVVQTNHPNIAQMIGDRDLDGKPDAGFEKMFGYMDVIEVHPPELIFEGLGQPGDTDDGVGSGGWEGRGNAIVNWLQLLNLGYRVTGVVNTDAHYNNHGSGWLRNWVRSSTDDPAAASVAELVHEFEHGHVVMSNGPYLSVLAWSDTSAEPSLPGDDLSAPQGDARLRVQVQCPNWLDVNRVQVFVNGRPSKEHNYTVRSHTDWFKPGPRVFDRTIEVSLEADAHLVVAACGEGRQLGAIYGEQFGKTMPVAVANPVFVDTNGDKNGDGIAFEWNNDGLGAPLPKLNDVKPSHGHDHANHTQ